MKKVILLSMKFACFFIVSFLLTQTTLAQAVSSIMGKVLDSTGESVIGASVLVKGTTSGTITDIDGNFKLDNVPSNATLVVSYIGYQTQEIPVAGKKNFTVKLADDTQTLEEVVVVGYGVQRKSDLTGSVASIKAADAIKSAPSADITSALQGRLAGVSIMSSSGQPGSSATIRIRGTNSIKGDSGPLVVIDGFIGGSLSSLNPSDIASIEVLKDASATAVYGSRGANGVILVTTRNPEVGKVKVEYSGYVNFKTPYSLPDMMSPGDFARLANEYGQEYYTSAGLETRKFYDDKEIAAFDNGGGYDYFAHIFRDVAIEHNHELSISGGSEKTKFIFSGSYNNNQGISQSSNAETFNYRLKVDTDIKSWLKAGVNFWGNYSKSQGPRFSQYRGVMIEAMIFPNTIQPKDEEGHYNNMNLLGQQYNPMGHIWEIDTDGFKYTSRLQGYVDINILKGLTFRMTQGFTLGNKLATATYGRDSYTTVMANKNLTSATATSDHNYSWTNQNILSYVREFNKDHRINATAVLEQMYSNDFTNKSEGYGGLASTVIGADNVSLAEFMKASTNRDIGTILSWMGRVNYVFKDRYMLTASWRYDGSSRLDKEYRWQQFPSVALAWNAKQEKFLRNVDFLSQLKLRLGYGETGNQAVPFYAGYTELGDGRDSENHLAIFTKRIGTPDLAWERTKQWNGGIDFGAFNNRLTVSLDVYHKLTEDVLLEVNAAHFTGYPSRQKNAAHIVNKGFEITIGADPIVTKDFNWNTNLTLSHNDGRIKDLYGDATYMVISGNYENKYFRNIKGEKLGTMWGYVNDGVWKSWELDNAPKGTEAGSYRYKDIDGVDGISKDDQTIIGNGQPTFQWGWNNTLNYKNFDFGLFIIGVHGFDIYNYTREARFNTDGSVNLGPNPEWANRWTPQNENSDIAGFVKTRNALTPSSQYVEKGDFVKVKSITLGYSLSNAMLNKAGINKVRVYASIQNPFLFTGYSGIDPEVTLKSPLTSGIDWGYYPNGRNYLIGLNFAF
ncbi:TonB-dependent receptor [Bacteroides nordii]|uniref:SusC/RagA family TonB-linked outer membrane protein n=1 Tax=Bacteroides nordii TaxID=291645 RepID=UPI002A7EDB6C|nr:TonB-dependent receptor [Bacteroides nordii]